MPRRVNEIIIGREMVFAVMFKLVQGRRTLENERRISKKQMKKERRS